jgi:hypothetical protein
MVQFQQLPPVPPAVIPKKETRMTADYLQKQGPGP